MSEFSLRYGSMVRGALHAVGAAVKYILVPLVLIILVNMVLARNKGSGGNANLQPLIGVLAAMQPIILLLGSVLAVLAFFAWYYPKGSRSRLLIALGFNLIVSFYGWMLLLDGRTEAAVTAIGPHLSLILLFGLLLVLVTLSIALEIGEYVDNRREWLFRRDQAKGSVLPPLPPLHPEDAGEHRWYHDFHPRYGRLGEGMRISRKAVEQFLVYPLVAFIVAESFLKYAFPADFDNIRDVLNIAAGGILVVGISIAGLSFFKGFYPKGSYSRMSFTVVVAVVSAVWIWTVTSGGNIDLNLPPLTIQLDYQPLVLLFTMAALLWAVYAVAELISYRKDWIEAGFVPVNDKLIRKWKAEEKERCKAEQKTKSEAEKH